MLHMHLPTRVGPFGFAGLAYCLSLATGAATAGEISFAPVVNYAAGHPSSKLAVADMNGDGFPDIALNHDGAESGDSCCC